MVAICRRRRGDVVAVSPIIGDGNRPAVRRVNRGMEGIGRNFLEIHMDVQVVVVAQGECDGIARNDNIFWDAIDCRCAVAAIWSQDQRHGVALVVGTRVGECDRAVFVAARCDVDGIQRLYPDVVGRHREGVAAEAGPGLRAVRADVLRSLIDDAVPDSGRRNQRDIRARGVGRQQRIRRDVAHWLLDEDEVLPILPEDRFPLAVAFEDKGKTALVVHAVFAGECFLPPGKGIAVFGHSGQCDCLSNGIGAGRGDRERAGFQTGINVNPERAGISDCCRGGGRHNRTC